MASLSTLVVLIGCVYAGTGPIKEVVILTGEYVWNGEKDALEAVFTRVDEGSWDVIFYSTWDGQPSVWKGTAEGNLSEGELRGKAHPEGQRGSSYVFFGSVLNGTFEGTYYGPGDVEYRETGALILSYSQGKCKGGD